MAAARPLCVLRGGGDLATGVAWHLSCAGWPVVVLELPQPLTVRRTVALSTAVTDGEVTVQNMRGVLVSSVHQAAAVVAGGDVAVMVAPELAAVAGELTKAHAEVSVSPVSQRLGVVVDARLAKRNIDTSVNDAALVVGLGPGFVAGEDCHVVIETMRGPNLGKVYSWGSAQADTGIPAEVAGHSDDRVLRADVAGKVTWEVSIGDPVAAGQRLGDVSGVAVSAPFSGVLRGAIRTGTTVAAGLKIGDVDPRGDPTACQMISDKASAVGTGVLEAVLASPVGGVAGVAESTGIAESVGRVATQ